MEAILSPEETVTLISPCYRKQWTVDRPLGALARNIANEEETGDWSLHHNNTWDTGSTACMPKVMWRGKLSELKSLDMNPLQKLVRWDRWSRYEKLSFFWLPLCAVVWAVPTAAIACAIMSCS